MWTGRAEVQEASAERTAVATSTAFGASEWTQMLPNSMCSSVPSSARTVPVSMARRAMLRCGVRICRVRLRGDDQTALRVIVEIDIEFAHERDALLPATS